MKYGINIYNYAKQAIPFFLRKEPLGSWVKALLAPVQSLNDTFDITAQDAKYQASFTGQVMYLEHLLNDSYDKNQRRIVIEDGNSLVLPPFLFNKIEQEPLYVFNKSEVSDKLYLYNKVEYANPVDFIVYIPTILFNNYEIRIRIERLINKYKLAGKTFAIKPI